jgi:hypothetical protein
MTITAREHRTIKSRDHTHKAAWFLTTWVEKRSDVVLSTLSAWLWAFISVSFGLS